MTNALSRLAKNLNVTNLHPKTLSIRTLWANWYAIRAGAMFRHAREGSYHIS